jgi:AcrR family transcriptional regulator
MRRPSRAAPAERIDERVERSKKAVLSATYRLMSEVGLGGTSIDAIARLSGVAKTTIYRHWPTRSALLLDACSRLAVRPESPNSGDVRADLLAQCTTLAHQLRSARWATILPSIIDAAEHDPEIAAMHTELHKQFTAGFHAILERGLKDGTVPRGRDASPSSARCSIAAGIRASRSPMPSSPASSNRSWPSPGAAADPCVPGLIK